MRQPRVIAAARAVVAVERYLRHLADRADDAALHPRPRFTETPLMSASLDDPADLAEARRQALAAIPQAHFAIPGDVAAAVAYFASPDAAHLTCASLAVDEGSSVQ
jgi:NAD(P)-dependent dehydrogenase (short-subunit alcohol dehydrogenase family)